jgi:tetratricopeptide (TPR) repeat protein
MTNLEVVQHHLAQLRTCPQDEIPQHFPKALQPFQSLPNADKMAVAQPFYDWAIAHAEAEPQKLPFAEFLLGVAHHLNDENESALHLFTKARQQFEEQSLPEGVGLCATLIGSVYRTLGNVDLAMKTLWEAYGLLKDTRYYQVTLNACTNVIANINFDLHQYDEALSFFDLTYTGSDKINDPYFRIYALHGLGKTKLELRRTDEARRHLEEALHLAERHGLAMAVANSFTELGKFHMRSDDLAAAERDHKKALAIREEHQLLGAATTSYILLGELYVKQSRWDDAQAILDQGLALAERIKVKPKMYQIHFLLSEVCHARHDLKQCLVHFKRFHELRDQVEKEDSARKLSDAKLVFEAEQTRKENVIIKQQKAEIERKNIELQETIDDLTLARVSRKAKAFTLGIAIILFVIEDTILHFALHVVPRDNYLISLLVKMVIIFSLSPINKTVEHYLLVRVIKDKMQPKAVVV